MTTAQNPSTIGTSPNTTPRSSSRWTFWGKILIGLWLCTCLFLVDETEVCLVERLGRISAVYDRDDPQQSDRGLHFKLPWPIEVVRRFDRRLQLFDPPAREMFTRDRKNLTVGSYISWRIAPAKTSSIDLLDRPIVRFYRGLGTTLTTESRLDTRLRSILAAEIGGLELSQLIATQDSEAPPGDHSPLTDLASKVLQRARQRTEEQESLEDRYGIELVDYGIKRLNLPEANLFAVYERMRKEREKIAQYYRSAGEAEKTVIESRGKRRSEELLAQAQADAIRIRSEGEAQALEIRNQAFALDPELFRILRTLETYRKILHQKTTVVLSAQSPLFRLLTDGISSPATLGGSPSAAPLPPPVPAKKSEGS